MLGHEPGVQLLLPVLGGIDATPRDTETLSTTLTNSHQHGGEFSDEIKKPIDAEQMMVWRNQLFKPVDPRFHVSVPEPHLGQVLDRTPLIRTIHKSKAHANGRI